jgi:5-methylcytosine-specific restriction endonuclease McrA
MNTCAAGGLAPALVLNADFRPLSYFPLSLWSWQDVIKAVVADRVQVLSEYEVQVHSPSTSLRLPSVVALREYAPRSQRAAFTRFNVFLRDRFCCQYCGQRFPSQDLTFDHVVPRSRGGNTSWENVVTACQSCNLAKADHMPTRPGCRPVRPPFRPSAFQLQEIGRSFPPQRLHQSWRDFLYWDTELEETVTAEV